MLKFNDYLKEAALSAKQKKIAAVAGDKDKIDSADLAALRAGKKVEEAKDGWSENDSLAKPVTSSQAMADHSKYFNKVTKLDPKTGEPIKKDVKEEVELDEGRVKELAMDLKDMSHDEFHKQYGKPKSHFDPTNFKKPVEPGKGMDRAKALAQRGMQSLSKEEVERIEEKLAQIDEYMAMPDKNAVDRERDELKNFRGYKKNAGIHTANVSSNIKDKHPKTIPDHHPVPDHAPITAADKKAPHKTHSNPFAKGYHSKDNQLGAHIKPDNTPAPRNNQRDSEDKSRNKYPDRFIFVPHKPEDRNGRPIKDFKEEVERIEEKLAQIDELSKKTLGSYVKRSANQAIIKSLANPKDDSDDMKTIAKREKGINLATSKLAKEEVEQEMSPYLKGALAVMDEGKIDNLRDAQKLRQDTQSAYDKNYKPDTSHPHIQVVKGNAYGGANQKDDEGDEKPDETKEKKGRGRPTGKVGKYKARGSKSNDKDVDGREFKLHL